MEPRLGWLRQARFLLFLVLFNFVVGRARIEKQIRLSAHGSGSRGTIVSTRLSGMIVPEDVFILKDGGVTDKRSSFLNIICLLRIKRSFSENPYRSLQSSANFYRWIASRDLRSGVKDTRKFGLEIEVLLKAHLKRWSRSGVPYDRLNAHYQTSSWCGVYACRLIDDVWPSLLPEGSYRRFKSSSGSFGGIPSCNSLNLGFPQYDSCLINTGSRSVQLPFHDLQLTTVNTQGHDSNNSQANIYYKGKQLNQSHFPNKLNGWIFVALEWCIGSIGSFTCWYGGRWRKLPSGGIGVSLWRFSSWVGIAIPLWFFAALVSIHGAKLIIASFAGVAL